MTPRLATATASAGSSAATATPLATDFVVRSDVLGTFTIRPDSAIEFPEGLLGMEEFRRFAFVRAGTDTVFWLQSLDSSGLVFLLVDPFVHFANYVVDVPAADALELGAKDPSDVAVLVIVTLPQAAQTGGRPTANLQGPIVLNPRTRRAKQIICRDADYGVRCEFDLSAE
jgi:flagellar assembly factor FliW